MRNGLAGWSVAASEKAREGDEIVAI